MLENVQVGQEQHPDDDEARKAQKLEEVAVKATATALSADKVEQIAQSLDYVKDVTERAWARRFRGNVIETLLYSPEKAFEAGESAIGRECVERLVKRECPLPFRSREEYILFVGELRVKIETGLHLRSIEGNLAQHVEGFWIAVVGSSVSLWSENPRKHGRLFDEAGHGTSDLDVVVAFAPSDAMPLGQEQQLVKDIFFGTRSCSPFSECQYGRTQTAKRFHLDSRTDPTGDNFLRRWGKTLGRDINVTVAYTRAMSNSNSNSNSNSRAIEIAIAIVIINSK